MSSQKLYIDVETAERLCHDVFSRVGMTSQDASVLTESLIQADLRGIGSHGISRVKVYVDRIRNGWVNHKAVLKVISDRPSLFHFDGDNGVGAVIGTKAMDKCIERAADVGASVCSVRNCNHFGIASFFTMRAVRSGMVGFAASNNPPNMAPWGGMTPLIGTNPFSFAAPTKRNEPFVVDMSSSIVARGRINVAEIENQPIPLGWAVDSQGRPTQDAREALDGAVLPFGQHKGYGIALAIDIICGVLSGAAFSNQVGQLWDNDVSTQNIGLFFMVIDPKSTVGTMAFCDRVDVLIDHLKGSKPAEGFDRVRVPGEIEKENERVNRQMGILVGKGVLTDLDSLCTDFGIPIRLSEHITEVES